MRENDGQWRAELVSGNGQEFVFESVGFAHSGFVCSCICRFLLPADLLNGQPGQLRNTFNDRHIPYREFTKRALWFPLEEHIHLASRRTI